MAIEANRRHHLYDQARASWDAAAVDTLMDMLPPDPDALATRQDVALLGAELRKEMADLRAELHEAIAAQTRTLLISIVTLWLTGFVATLGVAAWA